MLGLEAMPVLAIPEAEAIRKLEVVAVHVVVNAEGEPIFPVYHYVALNAEGQPVFPFHQQLNQLVLPMFMTAEQAQQEKKALEGRIPDTEGSRVVSMPLNVALERNERLVQEIKARDESQSLVTPLVPAMADWRKAEELLRAEGFSRQEIARNLKVPVFLTHPPISITPPGTEEAKIALFFNYSQLQQAKQAVPGFEGEDKVLNLTQALNLLVQEEEDTYFFFPTEDLIKTFQAQQEAAQESDP
ncbi:MAG: phage portal protein [Synechococcus sp. SB0676_bin_10]|uniref:Phage portal protein n=1 Tax=Synechococcus sp. SB0676_bin_10 TaxID=2604869 RepID=A0A6B1FCE0_9SYNE|nr:phage portal protein [Synechococcus sp. SB0676_bin_10]MYK06467.1 phage portal protein [Synechococcus sp. SB0670_bin_20]